jgi:uncharacterized RDD family membrane protein YckC
MLNPLEAFMQDNNFEYVGFWPRVGATIIDSIIILVITCPILFFVYGSSCSIGSGTPCIAWSVEFLVTWVFPAVAVILFWLNKRATPGKMAVSA